MTLPTFTGRSRQIFTEPRLGCGAAVVADGRILLLKRKTAPEQGHWGLPGGKVDLFETAADAVRRETLEELGIELDGLELLCVVDQIDRDAGSHWVAPVFIAHRFFGAPRIVEPEKHEGVGWFAFDDLPRDMTIATIVALDALRQRTVAHQPEGLGSL